MLQTILSITGRPGLYKLVSQGRNMLIVESLIDKKRRPAYSSEKAVSLGDIAMYTEDGEIPLSKVLLSMKEKENAIEASIDPKKATTNEISEYFESILPNYDHDRVYISDIKKLISWYNLLIKSGNSNFEEDIKAEEKAKQPAEETGKAETTKTEDVEKPKKATKKAAAKKNDAVKKATAKKSTKTVAPRTTARKTTVRKAGDK
jgi:hypothetical protein